MAIPGTEAEVQPEYTLTREGQSYLLLHQATGRVILGPTSLDAITRYVLHYRWDRSEETFSLWSGGNKEVEAVLRHIARSKGISAA